MAGRKWSSLLHAGSHYFSLEVHVIANALQMDGILVWAPQNPLTITLTTHWGPSLSFLKRKRKNMAQKKCVTALVQRLLEKRQRSGTWLFVLADVIFFWQASAPPHLHVFPYLFLSRGCCSTWAEASDEALSSASPISSDKAPDCRVDNELWKRSRKSKAYWVSYNIWRPDAPQCCLFLAQWGVVRMLTSVCDVFIYLINCLFILPCSCAMQF